MPFFRRLRSIGAALLGSLVSVSALEPDSALLGQEVAPPPRVAPADGPFAVPPCAEDRPLPINLPTALQLANAQPIDVAVASERVRIAAAELERAKVLWLPTLYLGPDYFRHDGQIQDVVGNVIGTSKQAAQIGIGPFAVFSISDAIVAPLAARQVVRAREAGVQVAQHNSVLAVAEAYFTVQQARGELAGALDVVNRATDLVGRAGKLAPGLVLPVEVVRARTDLAERRQDVETARERWRLASADLIRILRLDPTTLVDPQEPPQLQVTLVGLDHPVDELIPVALTNRPELAAQQALVQVTLQRLRQERLRPLVPSVWLRGASTNPAAPLSTGYFGGGVNDSMGHFNWRNDMDIQLLWELQNLGFGNRALIHARQAEHQASILELLRVQDQVAADVVRALAQAQSAAARVGEAEAGLNDAVESVNKNFEGLSQTVRAGNLLLPVIRPQEAVAAVQTLGRAYARYYGAVADYNRAQYRLFWALGQPAEQVNDLAGPCAAKPPG